jgi:excinuclease ABC subunit C
MEVSLNKINKIPEKIGVYLFKDKNKKVLYIGKSINLKKRINDHLKSKSLKIQKLIKETEWIEIIKLNSEVEALLKEAELIKKFDPPYNTLLRDDSRYFYIIFTEEDYPKILVTHQPEKFKTKFKLGPFTEGSSLKTILKIIRREIPFCTCLKKHQSSCLNSLIGLCYGWCCKKNEQGDQLYYQENLMKIKEILEGNFQKLKINLLNKLEKYLNNNDLLKAEKIKKEILALNKLINHQGLISEDDQKNEYLKASKVLKDLLLLDKLPLTIEAYDISHWAGSDKVGISALFKEGKYLSKSLKVFKIKFTPKPNDPQMIYEVLYRRLRHKEWTLPDIILIDGGRAQFNAAFKALIDHNLENYVKIISIAKPTENLFYDKNKKPINLNKLPFEFKKLIKFIDKKVHLLAINYHRQLRNKKLK